MMPRPLRRAHYRFLIWTLIAITFVLAASLLGGSAPAAGAATDVGYRDFSYGTSCNSTPTGEKPESKLWFNDGFWWASLCNSTAKKYHIYRLDLSSQTWIDTGTLLDDRPSSKADALWDGTTSKLYVVSHVFTKNGQPSSTSSKWGRVYRYSYNATTKTYTLDSGFPVNVTQGIEEALTIAKDSTGELWVTYVENSKVMVNHSVGSELVWSTPFVLPVSSTAVSVSSDDISAVVAFQGNKIGVMWSNQNTKKMYFSVHQDADADKAWQQEETALPGPGCSGSCADDHINLKAVQVDSTGRVFAATKTSLTASNAPLIFLLVRDLAGKWTSYVFGRVSDNHTRPIMLLDEQHGRIHMFATSPQSGGAIYYKTSDIDNINFTQGVGAPFIQSSTDLKINNATSTKQNVDSSTGLVVLASDSSTDVYLHNYLDLGGTAATATPSSTATITNTPSWTPTPTNTPAVSNTPTFTPTAGPSPTATSTPNASTRIKDITFENGSLTDPTNGADSVTGSVTLETTSPLIGAYSAHIPNAGSSYLTENFSGVDDLYVSFYLRLNAIPTSDVRIALISNAGVSTGSIFLRSNGVLQLKDGSTTVGTSTPLTVGTLYRVGMHQRKGAGSAAVLEGYLATGNAVFGSPFASTTTGTWTTQADRFRFGATISSALDAVFDNDSLDSASMPPP